VKFIIILFLLICNIYLLFSNATPLEGEQQLDVARIIVREGALSTESVDASFAAFGLKGVNGRLYDCHGITNVLLMIPVATLELIFKHFGIINSKIFSFLGSLAGTLINSLVCLVFFSILQVFKRPVKFSFYATLYLAFGTIVFPYASHNYEGNLNMLFIISSLYFLFRYKERNKISDLFLCCSMAGLSINTREVSWLFLLCLLGYLFFFAWKKKEPKPLFYFLFGLIPYLAFWGYYNFIRTGSVLIPGTVQVARQMAAASVFTGDFSLGLRRLLISKGGSIFVFSPVILLSVMGIKRFIEEEKEAAILILSIISLLLLFNAGMVSWFGSWGWGSRYTLDITPLMMLPLGYWLTAERLKKWYNKSLAVLLFSFGAILGISANVTNWHGRLNYLIHRNGISHLLFTAKYSQWWDSLKTLFINLWNLIFGHYYYISNPGYADGMSEASLCASKTIFTWWNRLLFLGVSPKYIVLYFILSFILIFYSSKYIVKSFSRGKIGDSALFN